MGRPISDILKNMIQQQGLKTDPVANLFGSSIIFEPEQPLGPGRGSWLVNHLDSLGIASPDDIISRLGSILSHTPIIVDQVNGVLTVGSPAGTTLVSTVVTLAQALGFPIEINAPNKQIALYVGENLIRRGYNSLVTTINLPAGKTPLSVVFYGNTTSDITIRIPNDIPVSVESSIPPTPALINSGINSNYVDPRTGATGISLSWFNQENVGGWGVYRVINSGYGTITNTLFVNGKLIITTAFSGSMPSESSVVQVGNVNLGIIESIRFDQELSRLIVIINPFQREVLNFSLIHSGTLNILNFENIGNIIRASQGPIITFVDLNVEFGKTYSYCIDSYSPNNILIRSKKTPIITVVAGDIFPPGSIKLLGYTVDSSKRINISYITPTDLDYYATKAVFYYQGSGTGQIANIVHIVDVGISNSNDSLVFQAVSSGTFYFVTSDIVGNTQYVLSGVPLFWNGTVSSGAIGGISNTAPTISISQLSAAEIAPLDPRLFASFRLAAFDQETPSTVQLQFQINSGFLDPFITAPTNPYTVTFGRRSQSRVKVRAFDGILFSDELTVVVDYDASPQVSSLFGHYSISSGSVSVVGTVDDDTQSLEWFIQNGTAGVDPLETSPSVIPDLVTVKNFSFSFLLADGQEKILVVVPYPSINGEGVAGILHVQRFSALPRTIANISERTIGGAVTRVDYVLSLSSTPRDSITFFRRMPVDYGTVS